MAIVVSRASAPSVASSSVASSVKGGRHGRAGAAPRRRRPVARASASLSTSVMDGQTVDDESETMVRMRRAAPVTSVERARPLRLLTSYASVVDALRRELDTTQAGDVVRFSVYVFERGQSSNLVIAAMKRAVKRGVKIECEVDGSLVSKFTRWCEQSTTLTSELESLERELGRDRFSFTPVQQASHAKFMIVHRKRGGGLPSVIFGGVNIGDRFARWRDVAIRAEGQAVVDALKDSLSRITPVASSDTADLVFSSNMPSGFCPMAWTFPRYFDFPGRFGVRQAMKSLLEDGRYSHYLVAMAYIDAVGADMLSSVLRRENATLTLVVPRTPNVYHDANRKSLKRLVEANGGIGRRNLKIYLLDDMLHAKAFYAEGDNATTTPVGMLGSCNLKQRSLGQFVELNASMRQPALTMALRRHLKELVDESLPLQAEDLLYLEPKATIEEWLG